MNYRSFSWRRRRDLNPRDTFAPYSLSRGAPSPLGYFSKGCCLYKKMWRRGWDSNPRALSDKRFSRPPRYDHFDTSPDRKLSCQARSIISQLCISVNCFSVLFLCLSQKKIANKSLTFAKRRCILLFNMLYYVREKRHFLCILWCHCLYSVLKLYQEGHFT